MADRILFSIVGFFGGLGVPLSWLLWRAFSVRRSWWTTWLSTEFARHYEIYVCLGMASIAVFGVIGYFFGRRNDEQREVSKNVEDTNFTLSHLATTDGLTGLFNSRYMHDRIDVELETTFRSPLTCLLVDIDFFKRINDKYGHPFGDEVIVHVARTLKRLVRPSDAVGRLGGEEFIVILPHTPKDRAIAVAERIRQALLDSPPSYENKRVPVTVSIGVVAYPSPGVHYRHGLLKAVDEALYAAKRSGRNRVSVWEPPTEGQEAA